MLTLREPAEIDATSMAPASQRLQAYLSSFAAGGSPKFIANLHTRVMMLVHGDTALPVTINDTEYADSYVCSPYTAFVLYSKAEMRLIENKILRQLLSATTDIFGIVLKAARINSMVQVNNWMLSTNLYPQEWCPSAKALTELLSATFPQKFICFRSLNSWSNPSLLRQLCEFGYKLIPSRQVYIYDNVERQFSTHSNAEHDRRLLRKTAYEIVEHRNLGDDDYERMAELYDMLYRRKYSQYNPAFTADFMRLCHSLGVMRFIGLRHPGGRLDGIAGLFTIGGTTSAPIVGYDTSLDRRLGLYRMLITLVLETATQESLKLNLSSGAASFKRLRGAQPLIEYSAIYDSHLSHPRKLAIDALRTAINTIAVPLLKRLEL